MSSSDDAVYQLDGERVYPTDRACGPWFPDHQHGASVIALLTRFLERVPSAHPMRITRVLADISRAVPMTDVTVAARALRDGRRVQSLDAQIVADGTVVARAVATRIRVKPNLIPTELLPTQASADVAPPFDGVPISYDTGYESFHDAIEIRPRPGANSHEVWYRLAHPLVAGESPSPCVRLAAVADMVTGPARQLGAGWLTINPEVMVQVEREPIGEWLYNASTARYTDDGIGVSSCVIYDRTARVGSSSKSILIEPR